MNTRYSYASRVGVFRIEFGGGLWHLSLSGHPLSHYRFAQDAADEIARGDIRWPGMPDDSEPVYVPCDLSMWTAESQLNTED